MPLPDAIKRSPRVYTLLQNLDLENLSADNLADVGDTIAIEEANEDELRRLCLVAFARMVTKGSFDGWLSGGASGLKIVTGTMKDGIYDQFNTADAPPYGTGSAASSYEYVVWADEIFFFPFQAQTTGTITSLGAKFEVAGSGDFAIYDTDSENLPNLLIVKGRLTATGTETVYQTSLTGFDGGAAGSLTVGETYWIGALQVDGASGPKVTSTTYLYRARCASTEEPAAGGGTLLRNPSYTKSTGLPDTVDNTNSYPSSGACPKMTYEV